jgi:superfamily I DNA and RNA helicase
MSNMHQLAKIVEQKGGWLKFPGRYSWLVIYPNGIANDIPALFDASTLITSRYMNGLASKIRNSLEQRGFEGRAKAFDHDVLEKIAQILISRPFSITKADSHIDVRDDVKNIENLTRQQFAALRGIFELPRVAVSGPAGSGKTLLAIWRLQALNEADKRGLYVCFNTKLAETLRCKHPEIASCIVSVDKFFTEMCPSLRSGSDTSLFFRETLPAAALDAAAGYKEAVKYDAIIVDEGQDFSELQLYALNELLRSDKTEWIIFTDRRQDLFQMRAGDMFGAEVIFKLYHNCRNTQRVNDATNSYLGKQRIDSMPGMPVGEPPVVMQCSDRETMAMKAWELAKQWSTSGGVVILSPYTLENSAMAFSRKGHSLTLSENLEDIGKDGIVYFSTIRSFKGIEAPAVILIDADIPSDAERSPLRSEDIYVACTRPTARLAILSKNPKAVQWFNGNRVNNKVS